MLSFSDTRDISDSQLRPLYESVGWTNYTRQFPDLSVLLKQVQLVYSAWDGDRLVGLIRTVGDGLYIQYIQDILVLPTFQKRGIGAKLLKYVLAESSNIQQVMLATDGSAENEPIREWYTKHGLTEFSQAGTAGFILEKKN